MTDWHCWVGYDGPISDGESYANLCIFVGRLTMVMEATKEIVSKEPLEGSILPDQFDRTPLEDAQLHSVDNLNVLGPRDIIGKDKLYQLANNVGLLDVVRWKPRLVR
jgi:large subunit ribosomal protein L15